MSGFRPARCAKQPIPGSSSFKYGKDIKAEASKKVLQSEEVCDEDETQPQLDEEISDAESLSEDSADDEAAFREHCKDMFEKFDVSTVSLWLDLEKKKFLKKQPPLKKQKK